MAKKKLLFITLSHLSSGEFTIAVEFARRLDPDKYSVLFLTSEKGRNIIEDSNLECRVVKKTFPPAPNENKLIIDKIIEDFDPDYFIHSDAYTTEFSYTWTGVLVDYFKQFNKPVINFDEYEYPNTGYVIDYYGDYRTKVFSHLNKFDYLIRNCPLNKWSDPEENVFCTSLYGECTPKTDEEKKEFRKREFKDEKRKYIFTATSTWEMLNITRLPALDHLMSWMPAMLMNYLDDLEEQITLVHVGPQRWEHESRNLEYIHYDYLHPERFEEFVLNADLFLTTNLVSITLSKAIFGLVPGVLVANDKVLQFERFEDQIKEMPQWYQDMSKDVKVAYPYEVFPFGWKTLLKAVLSNNDYVNTYVRAPLFQRSKIISILKKYLFDKEAIEQLRQAQANYVKAVMQLPTPNEIVARWR